MEFRWSEGIAEYGHCYPFTVKKWHSLGSFDIMYIIELPDQYKFNSWTCKCNKAFYFQFFHPRYCADTRGKNVKMWIVKVHHTKSSWWQEYQFYGIMWNWRHCSAKVMNFWPQLLKSFLLFMRIDFKLTTYAFLCSHPKFNTDFTVYWSVIYCKKPPPLECSLMDLLDFKYVWLKKFNYNSGLREYVNRLISYCRLIIVWHLWLQRSYDFLALGKHEKTWCPDTTNYLNIFLVSQVYIPGTVTLIKDELC